VQQSVGFLIQQVTFFEHLVAQFEAQSFSWPIIQFPLHFRNLFAAQSREVGFLWKVLPD
jgi:hypothetical protein